MNWGSITWQNSARGEISARLTGLKFHLGFLNKFCQRDACNYMKKVSIRAEISSLQLVSQSGLRVSARAEIQKNFM